MSQFRWNAKKEQAALDVAEDKLSNVEIAQRAGVTRQALILWKDHPDFKARVDQHVAAYRAAIRRRGIAIVENRVAALQDRWERMQRVIAERAEEMNGEDVAGGETGLLVRTYKMIGQGVFAERVTEYAVDTGLLKELRAHEEQSAKELGQWTDRAELEVRDVGIAEELDRKLAGLFAATDESGVPGEPDAG